eukprot:TRINITY_DN3397_c0_g1_i3.p1 TRINITY_DN3397_c0_g1~~TRINITY_DN3397_c0_g1_i3.p1  ORF type:complete len:1062 (+),score=296.77 TRINITY_DN3397_c0_g1_i3:72-3257(+)
MALVPRRGEANGYLGSAASPGGAAEEERRALERSLAAGDEEGVCRLLQRIDSRGAAASAAAPAPPSDKRPEPATDEEVMHEVALYLDRGDEEGAQRLLARWDSRQIAAPASDASSRAAPTSCGGGRGGANGRGGGGGGAAYDPRPYQREAFEACVSQNTIVCIPTGTGKTKIAAMCVRHFLDAHRGRKALFVVPTRPLVAQQAAYLRQHSRPAHGEIRVAEVHGDNTGGWDRVDWGLCLRESDCIVGIAEVLRGALQKRHIAARDLCLVVLDECHNATGNHPMIAMVRALRDDGADARAVRVVGLTASYAMGTVKDEMTLIAKRKKLEGALQASIIAPRVPPQFMPARDFVTVRVEENPLSDDAEQVVKGYVSDWLDPVRIDGDDLKKCKNNAWHIFQNMGTSAFFFYLKEGILRQLVDRADEFYSGGLLSLEQEMLLRNRCRQLGECSSKMQELEKLTAGSFITLKLEQLFRVLEEEEERLRHEKRDFRGIIFVERVPTTFTMSYMINERARDRNRALPCSGVGAMKDAVRKDAIQKFTEGKVPVLVATNAIEEGIDVSPCAFVIRFDMFATTKSHIQGSGRARARDAKIYYFENRSEVEEARAERLTEIARDETLAIPRDELHLHAPGLRRTEVHPFIVPGSGIVVTLLDCIPPFHEYCACALGRCPESSQLYEATSYRENPTAPPSRRLRFLKWPSPQGWQFVKRDEAQDYWRGIDVKKEILKPLGVRGDRYSEFELDQRQFALIVIRRLVDWGLMDEQLKATQLARSSADVCPLEESAQAAPHVRNVVPGPLSGSGRLGGVRPSRVDPAAGAWAGGSGGGVTVEEVEDDLDEPWLPPPPGGGAAPAIQAARRVTSPAVTVRDPETGEETARQRLTALLQSMGFAQGMVGVIESEFDSSPRHGQSGFVCELRFRPDPDGPPQCTAAGGRRQSKRLAEASACAALVARLRQTGAAQSAIPAESAGPRPAPAAAAPAGGQASIVNATGRLNQHAQQTCRVGIDKAIEVTTFPAPTGGFTCTMKGQMGPFRDHVVKSSVHSKKKQAEADAAERFLKILQLS